MKFIIYRHINKINGKCYIGLTRETKNPNLRWGRYGGGYNQKGQKKFWAAIKKYGWENFEHEILEKDISTSELANKREKYWIAYFDSFRNGYNATIGGCGATGHVCSEEARKINGEKHKGKAYHKMPHSEETKKLLSIKHKGMHNSPKTEFKKGHKTWIFGRHDLGKPVLQYDSEGNFVKEWDNVYAVMNFFGGNSQSCIRHCCRGIRKRYKGYIWRFKENENFSLKVQPQELIDCRRPVLQFDLEGNFIAEYESVIEAHRQTGIGRRSIGLCCANKRNSIQGYIWKYK